MNIEESAPTPPKPQPEYSTGGGGRPPGDSRERSGERRDRPPRRRSGEGERSERPRNEVGAAESSTAGGTPDGRREGGRSERGGRPERGGRGGRPERGERNERGGRGRPGPGRADSSRESAPGGTPKTEKASAAPAMADGPLEDLGGDLLASVSRSFSITINLLDKPLREPISVGYLLARAQDTVADTPGIPAGTRLEHLRALLEMEKYGDDPEIMGPFQRDLVAKQTHDGEKTLLKRIGRCLAWLEAQAPEDRWDLHRTLARIGRAQELDLLRFGDAAPDAPKPLATAAELDEYTYLIAGCVGELWTRLCQRHLEAGWSKLDEKEMLALGKRFGQGLQMVNILRDLPEDLANGRCYLPADLLAQHGLEVTDLKNDPQRARPLLDALRKQAVEHLDAGWTYVKALTSRKLRYAVSLPLLIGLETLGLLAKTSPLETDERQKISRGSVKTLMASATVGALFAPWLSRLHSKLRKKAA